MRMRAKLVETVAHTGKIQCLAYYKEQDQLVSGAADGAVKLWSVKDMHKPFCDFGIVFHQKSLFYHPSNILHHTSGVSDIALSETGFFAGGCDGTIKYFKRK